MTSNHHVLSPKPLVFTLVLALCAIAFLNIASHIQRKPPTELRPWETKFRGISSALILRDQQLAENFRLYKECGLDANCRAAFIEQRDTVVVRRAWRQHFDLLVVESNWAATDSAIAERQIFLDKLAAVGRDTMRDACVPKIVYNTSVYGFGALRWTNGVKHNFTDFDCPKTPGESRG